jgi:hypothetical protein
MLKTKKQAKIAQKSSNIKLSREIAGAITKMVLDGFTFFTSDNKGSIDVLLPNGKKESLKRTTIHTWIKRGTIIPGTQTSFREIWNEAQKQRKELVRIERQEAMIEEAEKVFQKTLKLKTNLEVRDIFGNPVRDPKTGRDVKKENHNLLRIKTEMAKFIAERLDAPHYSPKTESKAQLLVFSLAELRKMKEEENA